MSDHEIVGLLSTSDESQLDEKIFQIRTQRRSRITGFGFWYLLLGIVTVSLIANVVLFGLWFRAYQASNACKLPLAGLELDIEVNFGDKTAYGDTSDLDALDKMWLSMNTNPGIVALPMDHRLGTTDPFPWDTSKGLYVLNSYHSLHCLQGIYGFARNSAPGRNQTQTLEHVVHCLDVLRSEVMCTADDTPLSFRFQEIVQTERAPKRKCRDWNKLTQFVTENSACFHRYDPSDPRYDTLDEFMFCPPGSPYNALIESLQATESK